MTTVALMTTSFVIRIISLAGRMKLIVLGVTFAAHRMTPITYRVMFIAPWVIP
jgi:hypothetical protein